MHVGRKKRGGGYNIYYAKLGEEVARGQLWNGAQAIWRRETKKEGEEEYRIAAAKGASFSKGKWHTQLARPSSPFIYYAAESRRERKKVRVPLLNFPSLNRRHRLVMATEEKGEGEHFPKFVRRKKIHLWPKRRACSVDFPSILDDVKKGREKRGVDFRVGHGKNASLCGKTRDRLHAVRRKTSKSLSTRRSFHRQAPCYLDVFLLSPSRREKNGKKHFLPRF